MAADQISSTLWQILAGASVLTTLAFVAVALLRRSQPTDLVPVTTSLCFVSLAVDSVVAVDQAITRTFPPRGANIDIGLPRLFLPTNIASINVWLLSRFLNRPKVGTA